MHESVLYNLTETFVKHFILYYLKPSLSDKALSFHLEAVV